MTHYHVVAFHVGCLNDYDSGPIENKTEAIGEAEDYLNEWYDEETGVDGFEDTPPSKDQIRRWQRGTLVVAVEECTEPIEDCEEAVY